MTLRKRWCEQKNKEINSGCRRTPTINGSICPTLMRVAVREHESTSFAQAWPIASVREKFFESIDRHEGYCAGFKKNMEPCTKATYGGALYCITHRSSFSREPWLHWMKEGYRCAQPLFQIVPSSSKRTKKDRFSKWERDFCERYECVGKAYKTRWEARRYPILDRDFLGFYLVLMGLQAGFCFWEHLHDEEHWSSLCRWLKLQTKHLMVSGSKTPLLRLFAFHMKQPGESRPLRGLYLLSFTFYQSMKFRSVDAEATLHDSENYEFTYDYLFAYLYLPAAASKQVTPGPQLWLHFAYGGAAEEKRTFPSLDRGTVVAPPTLEYFRYPFQNYEVLFRREEVVSGGDYDYSLQKLFFLTALGRKLGIQWRTFFRFVPNETPHRWLPCAELPNDYRSDVQLVRGPAPRFGRALPLSKPDVQKDESLHLVDDRDTRASTYTEPHDNTEGGFSVPFHFGASPKQVDADGDGIPLQSCDDSQEGKRKKRRHSENGPSPRIPQDVRDQQNQAATEWPNKDPGHDAAQSLPVVPRPMRRHTEISNRTNVKREPDTPDNGNRSQSQGDDTMQRWAHDFRQPSERSNEKESGSSWSQDERQKHMYQNDGGRFATIPVAQVADVSIGECFSIDNHVRTIDRVQPMSSEEQNLRKFYDWAHSKACIRTSAEDLTQFWDLLSRKPIGAVQKKLGILFPRIASHFVRRAANASTNAYAVEEMFRCWRRWKEGTLLYDQWLSLSTWTTMACAHISTNELETLRFTIAHHRAMRAWMAEQQKATAGL